MRRLFLALLVLAAAVLLGLQAQQDSGYVLLAYGKWTLETSLTFFVGLLLALFIASHVLWRWLVNTWHLPERLYHWRQQRRRERARKATQKGLIALAEGSWQEAERQLSRFADLSDTPLLNYLGAARAAQKLGSDTRRDNYLSRAHLSMPDAELAVGLTQAEVQLSQGQAEQALATLRHLHALAPKHTHVLYLLRRLYEQLGSWSDLRALLPELRRHNVLPKERLDTLERQLHCQLLAACGDDITALRRCWGDVPRQLHHDPELLHNYTVSLRRLGHSAEAEPLLREALKRQWDNGLIRLYGLIDGDDPARQLRSAEAWLKERPHQADLLLALGRLALRSQLWGKARSYLEASVDNDARPESYCELGNLLHQLGEAEKAERCFRRGLELTVGGDCTDFTIEHRAAQNGDGTERPEGPPSDTILE